jgi:hypothetical protein
MDWVLLIMIGVAGGLSTLGMINILRYFHDKENKK